MPNNDQIIVVQPGRPVLDGGWSPVVGDHITELEAHLRRGDDGITSEEFHNVREEARWILGHALPPGQDPASRTGIVVGYVQSGKTMSMTAVSALAFDNGFRLVIALSGVTRNLHQQSFERFERDLRGSEVGHQSWVILPNPTVAANRQDLARLIQEWRSGLVAPVDQQALFMVVMKHHAHLDALAQLLQTADLHGVTALMIDDEADQAGLDTRPGTGNPSTTYRRIRAVRACLPRHTYLQYTATPQAPLLISLADMLSPEFAEVLQPGERYTGGETFFVARPQLVRPIPPSDLAPQQVAPPTSLLDALRVFFIGAVAHTLDRRGEKKRSMLVHPTRETPPQGDYTRWVERVIERWREVLALPPGNPERENLLTELRAAHQDVTATEPRLPPFEEIVPKMPVAVTRIVVTQVNSATGHEVDWNRGAYHILVGGEKMSRGYTVRGLTVTYMPRPPGMWMADTIQQRARFFGYKQRYIGFCRVYLPGPLIGAYQWYVRHEENVRDQLRQFRGRPLRDWKRAFFLQAPFRPTRQNVLTSPVWRSAAPAEWFEQQSPHFSSDMIESNRELVRNFVASLTWTAHEEARHRVARGVPLHRALEYLLVEYSFGGDHDVRGSLALRCRIADHLSDHAAATCTVIDMDATRDPRIRTARDGDAVIDLHQGRDPHGGGYPGDARMADRDCVTIQLHTLEVRTSEGPLADVRAVAVHIPRSWIDDVVVRQGT
jgi:hypothetical protein